jgi:hypothetical protein
VLVVTAYILIREGGHGRGELVGLGEHAAGLRLLNPHAVGAGSAPGGELEAVDRAGPDAALLDLEVRERGWEEVWVVGAEVRDQPADMLGRAPMRRSAAMCRLVMG